MLTRSSVFSSIVKYSLVSRLIYLSVSVITNFVVPDHDPFDVFSWKPTPSHNSSIDDALSFIFEGFSRWDAQHFYHIAEYGYTYENNLAFFPLFPYLLSGIHYLIGNAFLDYLNVRSSLYLASFILNLTCFTLSALQLYNLSLRVLQNPALALKAVLFYCFSPACIFFVASYSESLFALLSFSGMYSYSQGKHLIASLYFALATCTRSNGLVNLGFIIHAALFELYNIVSVKPILKLPIAFVLLKTCIYSSVVIAPYVLFQVYSYLLFCSSYLTQVIPIHILKYGLENNYVFPHGDIKWCDMRLPIAYSYVQSHYWNVGFLKYYELKQIPNFLLAAPVALIIGIYSLLYLKYYWRLIYLIPYVYDPSKKPYDWRCPRNNSLLPRSAFVFVVHALFLVLFCVFFINVQVTTRLLASSSPLIYWIAARFFVSNPRSKQSHLLNFFPFNETSSKVWGRLIKLYFALYCIVGIVAFSNYYPWT